MTSLMVVFLGILPLQAQQSEGEAPVSSERIFAALREMQAASRQLAALRRKEYQAGRISFPELLAAQHQLLEMELKLAKAPADRTKVLVQQLELAKDAEEMALASFKSGRRTESDVLQARIDRWRIEVMILEELK